MADLMKNYNKHVKPTMDANTKILVNVSFSLGRIESLVRKNSIIINGVSIPYDIFESLVENLH